MRRGYHLGVGKPITKERLQLTYHKRVWVHKTRDINLLAAIFGFNRLNQVLSEHLVATTNTEHISTAYDTCVPRGTVM